MASSSKRACASLSSNLQWKHDVFLSFRGEDTRRDFISHLYHELQHRGGIKTFKDDQGLEIGSAISPSILRAIKESKFAIVVLSPNYASSTWCLDELTKIFQFMKGKGRILPIFYHVDPSDVRYQKRSFEVAFTKHEDKSRQSVEKVKQWRVALKEVANLSGWDTKNFESENDLVRSIVEFVRSKVRPIEVEFAICTSGDFVAFKSTRRAINKVMKALKDVNVTALGVVGMGGVGKTSMVKHVAVHARKKGLFHHVIMTVVSQSPNIRKIQGTLADLLGIKLDEETEIGRAARLMEKITKSYRILIILDDLWERIDLSSIGIPSYDKLQKCNSKVLLTTRRINVCHTMESQTNIPLNILSEEDAWNLFVKKARRSFEKPTGFYDVARNVARECAGLPVALIAVARALGDKDLDEWKEGSRRLKASQPANPEDGKDVFKCIKLSYDYLRSDDAKSCFLLCCLFPEDYDIQIEDLLKYGIGKGLFQDSQTLQEARAKAHSEVKYLKASSLLLGTKHEGRVRMHDVVRDMAILISLAEDGQHSLVKAGCELNNWPKIDEYNGYSAISLMNNEIHKFPEELVCSELKILLLQNNVGLKEIPKAFFQSPNALRVLDLSNTSISLLSPSFCHLTNIHTLYLNCCEKVLDISILGRLKKLEILSMRYLYLTELPCEIGHLTNLRMLDVTGQSVNTIPTEVISRLNRLEELHMKCGFWEWGSTIEGGGNKTNVAFHEVTDLSYLNILNVCILDAKCLPRIVGFNPKWLKFDICIQRDAIGGDIFYFSSRGSRTLTIDTTINTLPDWFNSAVTKKAETLQYIACKGLNIVVEHDKGKLQGLKKLGVGSIGENLEVLINTMERADPKEPLFANLEELCIKEVFCLKEICVGELPPLSLWNLKILYVDGCDNMMNALLPSNLLERLQNLEVLICKDIVELEYVFGSERLDTEEIVLSQLREMELWNMWKLKKIWNGPTPTLYSTFYNLNILSISFCDGLETLFTSDVAQCLLNLECLSVEYCESLVGVIEAREEITVNKKIVFPQLKNLNLRDLPELTSFYFYRNGSSIAGHIDIVCPSLEHLYVKRCCQFLTSFYKSG